MNCEIKFENGHVETNITRALLYHIAVGYGKKTHEQALEIVELGYYLWLKDNGPTPVHLLGDYLSEMSQKKFKVFKEKSKYEQLDLFYSAKVN